MGDAAPLVKNVHEIRLALAGKVEENDHPYSWSAILNGYDAAALEDCPNPIIRKYLAAQAKEDFGIPGVRVTHIWCENTGDAERIAKLSLIPHIVSRPEDLIGQVDAVMIPTDKGHEHLDRALPFVDAGVPLFIDKPLTDCEDHLRQFVEWHRRGVPLMSSSAMRYAREFLDLRGRAGEAGALRLLTFTTCMSWERYGIHAMEAAYLFASPGGWTSVTNTGQEGRDVVHVRHASGLDVVIAAISDLYGAFGQLTIYGTSGILAARFQDSFQAFKAQLSAFVTWLRTGRTPYPFDETVELMKIIIAGICSRRDGGRTVPLSEIALREVTSRV